MGCELLLYSHHSSAFWFTYIDVRQMFRNSTLCGPNSVCTNIPGKYSCSCLRGSFTWSVEPWKAWGFQVCRNNSFRHFGDFSVGVKLLWNMVTYQNSHLFFLKKCLFIWVLWVLSWYMDLSLGLAGLVAPWHLNLVPQLQSWTHVPVSEDRSLTTGPLGKSPVTCLCPWFCGLTIRFLGGPTMVGRSKITLLTWLVVGNGHSGWEFSWPFSFPYGLFLMAAWASSEHCSWLRKLSEGRWLYGQGSSTCPVLLTLGAG